MWNRYALMKITPEQTGVIIPSICIKYSTGKADGAMAKIQSSCLMVVTMGIVNVGIVESI